MSFRYASSNNWSDGNGITIDLGSQYLINHISFVLYESDVFYYVEVSKRFLSLCFTVIKYVSTLHSFFLLIIFIYLDFCRQKRLAQGY